MELDTLAMRERVLQLLADSEPANLTTEELAERIGVDHWAMLDVCEELEDEGLIRCETRPGDVLFGWVVPWRSRWPDARSRWRWENRKKV